MLALVVVVPQLGSDEDVLALDDALINGLANAFSSLLAVGVVPGTINVAVAELDGLVDLFIKKREVSLSASRKRH